jgi:hypothetical protein
LVIHNQILRTCSISNRQLQNHLGGPYFTGFLVNILIDAAKPAKSVLAQLIFRFAD